MDYPAPVDSSNYRTYCERRNRLLSNYANQRNAIFRKHSVRDMLYLIPSVAAIITGFFLLAPEITTYRSNSRYETAQTQKEKKVPIGKIGAGLVLALAATGGLAARRRNHRQKIHEALGLTEQLDAELTALREQWQSQLYADETTPIKEL